CLTRLRAAFLIPLTVWGAAACSSTSAGFALDSFRPVTREGASISGLFIAVMALSLVVLLIVVAPLVYAIVRFRASNDAEEPEQVEGNRRLEIAWTGGALALVAILFASGVATMGAVGT